MAKSKKNLDAKNMEKVSGGMYMPDGSKMEYASIEHTSDKDVSSIPTGIVAERSAELEQLLPKGKQAEHPWYR